MLFFKFIKQRMMMNRYALALLVATFCVLPACGGDDDPTDSNQNQSNQNQSNQNQSENNNSNTEHPSRIYEDHDDSTLCLVPRGELSMVLDEEVDIEADQDLTLAVTIFLLTWSGSGSVIEEYCTVELEEDQTLRVHTYVAYGQGGSSSGGDSTAPDRRFFECDAPALEAGQYSVIHGEQTFQLEVPSQSNLDCGDSEFNQFSHLFDD